MERALQIEFPWKWEEPKKGGPIYVSKVGNVRVPVYRFPDGRCCVAWRQVAGGERIRETFGTKKEASDRADEIARAIADSLADVVRLTSAARDNYRLAMQELDPLGIPLHAAVCEYVAARKLLGSHTLLEAAKLLLRTQTEKAAAPPTKNILDQLVAQLQDDRRDEGRYIKPLSLDLKPFVDRHPDLRAVTEADVREWLRGLRTVRARKDKDTGDIIPVGSHVSPRRRDNMRDAVVTLMRFARKKEYLPADKTTVAEIIPRIAEGGEVTTYAPEEVLQILEYFASEDPDWLPWAATQALGGARTSEIFRLQWSAYNWDDSGTLKDCSGSIAISGKVARKTRVSRQAPIVPALAEWLERFRGAKGYVIPRKWKFMGNAHTDALARMLKALDWTAWDTNALRHSFGSHRLALTKNINTVAFEMGNSPAMVRESYNDPKPEAVALRYFGIRPGKAVGKILAFRAS